MSENYQQIKQRCLVSRTLYEDTRFPANATVLFRQGPYYGVNWKRPKELTKKPVFVKDGAVYYDIDQGGVGNCWFIASVACLFASSHKQILTRVVPTDQDFGSDYCGAFHFNFWSYGKWVEVVVDDRLPTYNNKLIYASNSKHTEEYWCPLLEKAFAKLHGNYDVIDGGRVHSSLVDLTGGIGEMIELKDKISEKVLRDILTNCRKMNSIMGAAIFNLGSDPGQREIKQDTGLYEGHAYSIIDVQKVKTRTGSITLLFVRNPWGRGEWNGSWSDKSPEWNSLSKKKKTVITRKDDGEFWISLTDFRKYFDELELCHLSPDGLTQELADNLHVSQWHISEHYGSWVKDVSAGGPPSSLTSKKFWSNPQFALAVSRDTTVVISLFEVDSLLHRGIDDISIGFVIFKLQKGNNLSRITAENVHEYSPQLIETSGPYWPYRERTVRYTLEAGLHVIVPCTFKANQAAEFYLRIFSVEDMSVKSLIELQTSGPDLVPMSIKNVSDTAVDLTFDDLADTTGVIDAVGLVKVLQAGLAAADVKQDGYSLETCRCLVGLFNTQSSSSSSCSLNKDGLRKLWSDLGTWQATFREVDTDSSQDLNVDQLNTLFQKFDFPAGREAVEAIFRRYGGRRGHITEEDFVQGFCKTLQQYRTFKQLQHDRKVNMTFREWMLSVLQT